MNLLSIKVGGLTGNVHKKVLCLGTRTSDSKYKGQTKPAQQNIYSYPRAKLLLQQSATIPKYLSWVAKSRQAVCYNSEIRVAQEKQFKDRADSVGKPERFQQCQDPSSDWRQIHPQKSNADSH